MTNYQTLREGRIQVKIDAEDRSLLDELVLQAREKRRGRRSPASIAGLLIPFIRAWCRRPRRVRWVSPHGEALRVGCRVRVPPDRVFQQFASRLGARGEENV